jgi:glycosyltransferase involved in cell wall biosynthesis
MYSGDSDVARGREGPFHNTLAGLSPRWERIDVLTPGHADASPTTLFGNVHIHPSNRPRFAQRWFVVDRVKELAAQRRYSLAVSHDHGIFSNGFAAMTLRSQLGIPYVSEIHHVPGVPRAGSLKERIQKWIAHFYVGRARGRATAFRAVNNVQMPALFRAWGVAADKILVLPSAYLDFDVFHPDESAAPAWDVIFCGRQDPNKGLDLLAAAAAIVARARPEVRFLVVGDGPGAAGLRADLDRRGISDRFEIRRWLETPDDLADCYRRSRLLLCTSYSEGGPRVVLEAMACATPVVSTPVGVVTELIEDRLSGRLVDWQPADIATAILEVLDDPSAAARMARLAHQAVLPLDRQVTLDNYVDAYVRLAEEQERRRTA